MYFNEHTPNHMRSRNNTLRIVGVRAAQQQSLLPNPGYQLALLAHNDDTNEIENVSEQLSHVSAINIH